MRVRPPVVAAVFFFMRAFRASTGETPLRFVMQRRVKRAASRIRLT